jgi:antagonist of KipI
MPALHVVAPGLLTTLQDWGRWGFQAWGVPTAGPMDPFSFRLANRLVGNPFDAACLEVTLIGPEIHFDGTVRGAVAGAEFELTLDERPIASNTIFEAPAGSRLRFGRHVRGTRAYLAVAGGLGGRVALGSRATHLPSRMGGISGRPLATGDRLDVLPTTGANAPIKAPRVLAMPAGGSRLRVVTGPHDEAFTDEDRARLFASRYTISAQSNRMGYRLEGPSIASGGGEMISDALPLGAIQVPPSGLPILLMADHATSGGYPLIATIITADVPLAGQLAPGDWIEFTSCSRAEAMSALIAQERLLL